jgi:hypothetical protein
MRRGRIPTLLALLTLVLGTFALPGRAFQRTTPGPIVGRAVAYDLSRAVRDLPLSASGEPASSTTPSRINPLADDPKGTWRFTWNRAGAPTDPLIGPALAAGARGPLQLRFQGVGNPFACGGCSPPDTNGDVGPAHYIQMVNATKVAIFDKSGMPLISPFDLGDLWSGGICASNAGDPIVLWDGLADRWLLSQFAGPSHMCVAISQTSDPLGSYHLYTFNVGSFPDYFKFGVWPDAYYMGANEGTYTAYAFEREKMLAGDPGASFVKFSGQTNFLLPGDLDGPTPPPDGTPGYFYTFKDNIFHGGRDRIELFALDVDWTHPSLSTFALQDLARLAPFTFTVCGFFNFDCARQRMTNQRIDVVSEWPMHRFPYRNFGDHETLLGNFAVGGGLGEVGAAIRWFELRNAGSGWELYQEGTHDPGDGNDRFMGSIAMDGAGNIALGYTVSSSRIFPGIRFATRAAGDPLGALRQEAVLINGRGSQTGSNRWGDYSAMAIDPADDCSFWYTNEYYVTSSSSNWSTAVGVFTFPGC